MRRLVSLLSLALALHAIPASSSPAKSRYIVEFANDAAGRSTLAAHGGDVVLELSSVRSVAVMLPASAAAALARNPNIALIEEDPVRVPVDFVDAPILDPVTFEPTGETLPWGIQAVQADVVAPGTSQAKVCIIDSGYALGHEDLGAANVTFSTTGSAGPANQDGDGHGTHVAGTISALGDNGVGVVGVRADGQALHIVRVFGDSGAWAYGSTLVAALADCEANGAKVVSMSLGGSFKSKTEERAFADAYARGVLSIAASGNNGTSQASYPASYAAVVSVGAVDATLSRAWFSQYNAQVELAAPGVAILSTASPNDDAVGAETGYVTKNGTSMATPHVSGVAALVWSHFPNASAADVRKALQTSALDLGATGRDTQYGFGLVQAATALEHLTNPPTSGGGDTGGDPGPGTGCKGKGCK